MTGSAADVGRLRWRCRRGMKELDTLLERFLETQYASCDEVDRRAFERLLALPDPDLHAYLALGVPPPADLDLHHVIERIARPAP